MSKRCKLEGCTNPLNFEIDYCCDYHARVARRIKITYSDMETLLIGAFRYALGRRTYVVFETVEILLNNWDSISEHDKQLFVREIKHAIEHNLAGDKCDVREWQKILARAEE